MWQVADRLRAVTQQVQQQQGADNIVTALTRHNAECRQHKQQEEVRMREYETQQKEEEKRAKDSAKARNAFSKDRSKPRISKGGASGEYNYTRADREIALEALAGLRALRVTYPVESDPHAVPDEVLIKFYVIWYCYLMHMDNAAAGVLLADGGHGVHNASTRKNYSDTAKKVISEVGRQVWRNFTDLPLADTTTERLRVRALATGYADLVGVSRTCVKDMTSHLMKWPALFPVTTDMRRWLVTEPIPDGSVPKRAAPPADSDDDM